MLILLVCCMPNSYLRCHTTTVSLVDLQHCKRASQSVSPLNESKKEDKESKSEDKDSKLEDKDKGSDSEEEELTPRPK